MAHHETETRTRDDRRPPLQLETHCAMCGGRMLTIRRIRNVRAEPDTEPLCEKCIEEICAGQWLPDETEQPGTTCTGASCGWCGRCS